MNLRTWLQKHPHPASIRAEDIDGQERVVRIGTARSRWRDAEDALAGAAYFEALDDTGALLRVLGQRPFEDVAPGPAAPAPVRTAPGCPTCGNVHQLDFARLLNDAHNAGAERHADAYRLAYEQQRMLVEVLSSRLQQLERAWHQLLMSQQPPEGAAEDPNAGMVAALLGSMPPSVLAGLMSNLGGARPAPAPKPSNGVTPHAQ